MEDKLVEFARFPEMNPGPVLRVDVEGNIIMSDAAAQSIFFEVCIPIKQDKR